MAFVGSDSHAANLATLTVTLPAGVQDGDVGLIAWAGVDTQTMTVPSGWTSIDYQDNGNLRTQLLTRVLTASLAGTDVTLTASGINKQTALLVVDRGDGVAPTAAITLPVNVEASTRTEGTGTATGDATAYSFVLSRGNTTLSNWAPPAGVTRAEQAFNTTTGETNGAAGWSAETTGPIGGGTWTSDLADLRGTTLLVALPVGAAPPTGDTATLTGTGTLTTAGQPAAPAAATLTGAGTLTAAAAPQTGATPTLTGTGTLTATGAPVYVGAAALTGSGTLGAAATPSPADAAVLTGAGTLTATGGPATTTAAALTGTGELTVDARRVILGTVTARVLARAHAGLVLARAHTGDQAARAHTGALPGRPHTAAIPTRTHGGRLP